MADEKKRYESGAVVAAVLGVAAGVGVLALAAAASSAPKPGPTPSKKGCTRTPVGAEFQIRCVQPGPESLMEFTFDSGYYIDSMDLEVDLTGIGAVDGTQKGQVTVRVLVLDEVGTLKQMFQLYDFVTPTVLSFPFPSVGVIGRSVVVEALGIVDLDFAPPPMVGSPYIPAGPRQLTLTRNGLLVASVR